MTDSDNDTAETLTAWCERLSDELDIDISAMDFDLLLDVAGEAAHGVIRPAAPLTTFLIGYAAGSWVTSGAARSHPAIMDAITRVRAALADTTDADPDTAS